MHAAANEMLSVAIAIEPPTEPAVVQMVAQSCDDAIGDGRCRPAAQLSPATVVAWYAVIRSEAPGAGLSIEFHDRAAGGTLIETRALAFSERDTAASRWASAGAVIAAFVAARDSAGVPPQRPRPLPRSEPAAPQPLAWNADLALLTGPGLDHGSYRWGGLARGYLALPQALRVLGLLSLRYAERPGDLTLKWWSVSCGVGARAGGRTTPVSAELTGELAFERFMMSAVDQAGSHRDDAAQNRFGGRLSVNVALNIASHLALVAGAEATALRPSVAITVGQNESGRAPAVGYAFSGGLRFFGGE